MNEEEVEIESLICASLSNNLSIAPGSNDDSS
jgi:hypothetical protein